eukprot:6997741-Prymnesium_polylepis.1
MHMYQHVCGRYYCVCADTAGRSTSRYSTRGNLFVCYLRPPDLGTSPRRAFRSHTCRSETAALRKQQCRATRRSARRGCIAAIPSSLEFADCARLMASAHDAHDTHDDAAGSIAPKTPSRTRSSRSSSGAASFQRVAKSHPWTHSAAPRAPHELA